MTEQQKKHQRQMVKVSNFRNKNEKASFMRKKKNLELLVDELNPIDQRILELETEQKNLLEDFENLKNELIEMTENIKGVANEIEELILSKEPIEDKILNIRTEMIKDCIHPIDHLIHNGDSITCRFCETRLRLVQNGKED